MENKIRIMARQMPCGIPDCDHSCGKEHHCGFGPRNRSRNRGQRNRSLPPAQDGSVPTVANLADQAGSSVSNMQAVVNNEAARLPPRQPQQQQPRSQSAGRGRSQSKGKPWTVGLCTAYHYNKLCPRGEDCRNAHTLMGANQMRRNVPSNPGPKKIPVLSYHPDHPQYSWAQSLPGNQPAGNANGQASGAQPVLPSVPLCAQMQAQAQVHQVQAQVHQAPAQVHQAPAPGPAPLAQAVVPQVPVMQAPQAPVQRALVGSPRPRSFSEATSGIAARMTVRDSLEQRSSNSAHLQALKYKPWREKMNKALGAVTSTFPGSLSSQSGKNKPRSQSEGAPPPPPSQPPSQPPRQ